MRPAKLPDQPPAPMSIHAPDPRPTPPVEIPAREAIVDPQPAITLSHAPAHTKASDEVPKQAKPTVQANEETVTPKAAAPSESKTIVAALHPHDTAKTIHPLAKDLQAPPEELPDPNEVTSKKPVPAAHPAASPLEPETPKAPPKQVDPYRPDGEPKDIFEMAEERFNNDDRLKDLRK